MTAVQIGFQLGLPAVLGWLGYAIAFAWVGATARRETTTLGAAETGRRG